MTGVAIPADILAELEALRDAFRADAAGLVDALATEWEAAGPEPSADRLRGLVRQAHSLAGTAGSFALATLSARARDLEGFLDDVVASGGSIPLAAGERLLGALRDAAGPA